MKKFFNLSFIGEKFALLKNKLGKKGLTILISAVSALLLAVIISLIATGGCHKHTYSSQWESDANGHWQVSTCHKGEKGKVGAHEWVLSEKFDENGTPIYLCSTCGYAHQHIYDAEKWAYNGRAHWRPILCEHFAAIEEEHFFDENTGVCSVCGCEESNEKPYELAFSYYVVDENGNPVADSNGSYTQVGVTYSCIKGLSSVSVDTMKVETVYVGDVISFTVEKSVFCYYTDGANKPLVEVISGNSEETRKVETIYPDEEGVYTVEVQGDTIISVANVVTSDRTITGEGTKENPFTINSEVDWLYFAMYVNDKSYYSINYNIGYWKLTTDLDFEGESIYVVGDGYSSANSVFCGNFDGGGHTISNFVLENSVSATVGEGYSNYLGLFGVVTGYVGVESVIANLTVENAIVNATAGEDGMVVAGGILGYGVGANIRNCTVRNCQINVMADDTYMSFAGGVVGYLQSGMTDDGMLFYSSVSYSVADTITIKGTGMLYSAGGIVGRVTSYNNQVTAFILNCHTSGSISDCVRGGGIAGELQRYSTVQNCYSTASVSTYSTFKTAVEEKFRDSVYDDRYAYAGGIVGYAENDTVVEGCFFDGSVYATALAGKSYAKQSNILAGYSKAGFADYYAEEVVLNNQADGVTVDASYLKNQLYWNEADWVFDGKYPTINQEEVARSFEVTVRIDGEDKHVCTIDSQYMPLSYRYILEGEGADTLHRYYAEGTKRTYGYYFDSNLTKRVPEGYVPMRDMTLYAEYADTAAIAGEYYIAGNGVSAVLTIETDGTYTYEESAILLKGEYAFDGELLTFGNAMFARLASTATVLQKASYYTFWAKLQANGDLHLFDCDKIYEVSADEETQNPNFTALARFYSIDKPLVMSSADNLSFTGGYYYTDSNAKHVFEFNNDYTGIYKKYSGENVVNDTFSYVQEGEKLVITLDKNGTQFFVTIQEEKPVSVKDNRDESYDLSEIDQFAGVWEKSATSHKIYTFDGMGNWTYEHYVYLTEDGLLSATKQTVSKEKGSYVVAGDTLSLTRSGIKVEATIENGIVYVIENGQPVQVEFTNLNSYKGVWYTASNKIIRYTLTLDGMNDKSVGTATLSGFQAEPLELRYTAVADDTLYLYVGDVVYAVLQYSERTGLFEGMFYDTATGGTTIPQTLYLYDDFTGAWVSDINGISKIKFNGFGGYNTTDESGNSLGVKGMVTIDGNTVEYVLDRKTEKAEFSYKGTKYVLSYNEYTNSISVSYGGKQGTIAKADRYADVVLFNEQGSYAFDGRGNFAQGGTVVTDAGSGTYKIQANGNISLKIGSQTKTITVEKKDGVITGYSLNGATLYVDNVFSGVWCMPEQNISITVGNIACMPENGQTIEIQGNYNGKDVTVYYDGTNSLSFELNGKTYSLINTLEGKVSVLILTEKTTLSTEVVTENIIVQKDDFFGVWTRTDNARYTLTFDGCGSSEYVSGGQVGDKQGNITHKRKYKIEDGIVTIYDATTNEVYATFVECGKEDEGAYANGDRYYRLLIA